MTAPESGMEIVVRGRNVEVPEHYQQLVAEKLAKVERYDQKLIRADVELTHEKNPRQAGNRQHVEITCRSRGPVVRAEASAEDFYKALDQAADKLERQMRQAAERRRGKRERRSGSIQDIAVDHSVLGDAADAAAEPAGAGVQDEPRLGQIVREKEHPAEPISIDEALSRMELVGHDFYLFLDEATGRASVVYRRHAYDYGLLRLEA